MNFSKPVKILIGVFTLFVLLMPFLIMPLVFGFSIVPALVSEWESIADFAILFSIMPFVITMPLMMCYPLLQLVLQVLYIIQIVKNRQLTDTMRILFILGSFFMPIITLPIYFILYIWMKPANETGETKTATEASV